LEHMPQDHPHRPKLLLALDIVDKVSREVSVDPVHSHVVPHLVTKPQQVDEHKHNRDKELRMVELYHMFGGTQEVRRSAVRLCDCGRPSVFRVPYRS
jgi:hypothetical protein